tara:strand:- start:241 stop:366 length:126 start_codon:yes stop_codon:yes gene_type:complete
MAAILMLSQAALSNAVLLSSSPYHLVLKPPQTVTNRLSLNE